MSLLKTASPAESNDSGSTLRVLIAEQEQAVRDALIDRVEKSLGVTADAVNTAAAVRKLMEKHAGESVSYTHLTLPTNREV